MIRLSGERALKIARALVDDTSFAPEPNRATLRNICDPETGEILDSALITYFKSPHSFTGEDVVELSCHGSPVLLRHLLTSSSALMRARPVQASSTLRALSNGRLNWSPAEPYGLINAQTDAAVRQAARQPQRRLSARLQQSKRCCWRSSFLWNLRSNLSWDDLPEIARIILRAKLSGLLRQVELKLYFSCRAALERWFESRPRGSPNVGKSSIFNSLAALDRAIVTDIPGTTRDSLSEL